VAACVLALLSVSAVAAPPNEKAKRSKQPIVYSERSNITITDEQKAQFLKFMELRSVLFTSPVTCAIQVGGVCVIEVPVVLVSDSSGTEYCVGLFPETVSLAGTTSTDTEKTVVWALSPVNPPPAGTTFTFYDASKYLTKAPGIIILSDKNKQMHSGALGDGTTPVNPTRWRLKNKHTIIGEAVYIPVVVRTDNAGTTMEKVSVCGTPDPRIAND
jgi:hypothetical protein